MVMTPCPSGSSHGPLRSPLSRLMALVVGSSYLHIVSRYMTRGKG